MKKQTAEDFKTLIIAESQAKAQDQAGGASAHFVERLIQAGQITTIEQAVEVFDKGVVLLTEKIGNRLAASMMATVNEQLKQREDEPEGVLVPGGRA